MTEKQLVMLLMIGCIVSTISIIISVDYLFKEKKYLDLGFATIAFLILILIARKLKSEYSKLEEFEQLQLEDFESGQ